MPAPASATDRVFRQVWWISLLVALGLLAVATQRRIARVEAVTSHSTWSVDAPRRDASSPTGLENGQRRLIVPGHHNPSFWWIMEAQLAAARQAWRLRHIDYDAAEGRELWRTALYRGWLIAVGWARAVIWDEPLGYAIEQGVLVADPLLLALLLVAGTIYTARRLGGRAASGFALGGVFLFPLTANFQPGAPDPHALAWTLAVSSVLPLLAAMRPMAKETGGRIRIDFAVAGMLGGLGFWNDAVSQTPVLGAIFVGGIASEFVRTRGGASQGLAAPLPWRAWAMAGALTTLAASVWEWAPHHFSWSLDAVNPVHAVGWWSLGEVLHAWSMWRRAGRREFDRVAVIRFAIGAVALTVWPAVAIASGSGALLAGDFYAAQLTNGVVGTVGAWLRGPASDVSKWATWLPALLMLLLPARALLGRIEREQRGMLVSLTLALLIALILAFCQLRWWNLVDGFAWVSVTALFAATGATDRAGRWVGASGLALLLPGLFAGFPPAVPAGGETKISPAEAQALVERDFAYWLAKHSGDEPTVLFSTPVFAGTAAYYGGFKVVASADENNTTGFLTAVRVLSADTVEEVSILLNAQKITHLALPLWDPSLDQLVRIGMAVPAGEPLPENVFAVALQKWAMPLWMEPLDYLIPTQPGFEGFDLRSFGVAPEQAPDLAVSRLADFFVQRGQVLEARALSKTLEAYPRSIAALGALAQVQLMLRDRPGLERTLENLIPALSRRAARNLPADRRISLATLLADTNHADLAREQLTACLENLDGKALRSLTPGSVVNLVTLSRALNVTFPDGELEALAVELVPPLVRASMPGER